jgi:hypothetical protein
MSVGIITAENLGESFDLGEQTPSKIEVKRVVGQFGLGGVDQAVPRTLFTLLEMTGAVATVQEHVALVSQGVQVLVAGVYRVSLLAAASIPGGVATATFLSVRLYVNGVQRGSGLDHLAPSTAGRSGMTNTVGVTGVVALAAGDVVQIAVYHDYATNLTFRSRQISLEKV